MHFTDVPPPVEYGPPFSMDFVAHLHGGRYSADVTPLLRRAVQRDPDALAAPQYCQHGSVLKPSVEQHFRFTVRGRSRQSALHRQDVSDAPSRREKTSDGNILGLDG